jgi:hypothetical protein
MTFGFIVSVHCENSEQKKLYAQCYECFVLSFFENSYNILCWVTYLNTLHGVRLMTTS